LLVKLQTEFHQRPLGLEVAASAPGMAPGRSKAKTRTTINTVSDLMSGFFIRWQNLIRLCILDLKIREQKFSVHVKCLGFRGQIALPRVSQMQ